MLQTTASPGAKNAAQPSPTRASYRVGSIDVLRGFVMIIMALDHVREYTYREGMSANPLDLATTTPALFFTRWITHFCAPVFVFLAGTSVFLQAQRKPRKELSLFLLKRGLWLILVDLIVMSFAFTFDLTFPLLLLEVIWAIGISMVLLGLAIWLPYGFILSIGLLIVLGHNGLDFYEAARKGPFAPFYSLLHRPGVFPVGEGRSLGAFYPFLPWTGLLFLGYCFGRFFTLYNHEERRKKLTVIGLSVIAFFILLRMANVYGDPSPWTAQKTPLFTFLSFLNTTKYPPSLLFLCMTIGPAILFLAWAGNRKSIFTRIATVYGQAPLFYFVLHFYLVHLISIILSFARGHSFAEGARGISNFPFKFVFPGEGVSLGVTYLIWIGVVAAMYPLCKWFGEYKQTHKQWWLSYL